MCADSGIRLERNERKMDEIYCDTKVSATDRTDIQRGILKDVVVERFRKLRCSECLRRAPSHQCINVHSIASKCS